MYHAPFLPTDASLFHFVEVARNVEAMPPLVSQELERLALFFRLDVSTGFNVVIVLWILLGQRFRRNVNFGEEKINEERRFDCRCTG